MKKAVRFFKKKFDRIYEQQVSPIPIGIFRIVFGVSVLIEIVNLFYFRQLFFDPISFIEPNQLPIALFLFLWGITIILITIGYQTKIAGIFNFIFAVWFLGYGRSAFGYEWHVDSLILSGSLLLLIIPADSALSVRNYLKRRNSGTYKKPVISFIYPALLILLIGGVYLDSVFYKVTSDMYMSGLALWAPASLPFNVYWDFQWILDWKYLMYTTSTIVLLYETLFIFLVWFKKMRTVLIVLGILFHIAIGIAFPLPAFGLIMVGYLMGGLSTDVYYKVCYKITGKGFRYHFQSDKKIVGKAFDHEKEVPWPLLNYTKLNKSVVAIYLVVWFFSLFFIHFRSPFYGTYIKQPEPVIKVLKNVGRVVNSAVYRYTGFSPHGLYIDSHFREYNYQIKLTSGNNGEVTLPIIRPNGMAGWYNIGRNHVYWTFRSAGSRTSDELMEERFKRFILFWAIKNGLDHENLKINIYSRAIEVSLDDHIPGLLHSNMSGEWFKAGEFHARNGEFKYNWIREFR